MNRAKQNKSPSPSKGHKEPKHWSHPARLHETILSTGPEGLLNLVVQGGSENGLFCYVGDIRQEKINYHSGKLHKDEIILEIQGQKVSGFTRRDLLDWLQHVSKNSQPVMFKTIKPGALTKDLREYLNTRFQKNSLDHDLQQTIRDNIYRRTVPCTTRPQRPGEIDNVDYKFLTVDEFLALEKSGNLLESGLYDGNHYGTPKPSKDATDNPFRRTNSMGTLLPGQHPSSEGKRRRNRSNIEMTTNRSSIARSPSDLGPPTLTRKKSLERAHSSQSLGPLPPNWEMSYTEDGVPYFIDHQTETTHWLDPRLANNQKLNPLECDPSELPYGWEKVEDSVYGTYYIDHVNRKTQYENPVIQAKRLAKERQGDKSSEDHNTETLNGRRSPPSYESHRPVFTKNPAELKGKFIRTELSKSPRGFGFTIIGGEDSDTEFLQIKSVVPNGPAFNDNKLQRGDVLVYINSQCVLGFTHQDVVCIFQTIPIGGKVALEICRGYPLPFDPDDPNTQIITTVAVTLPEGSPSTNTPSMSNHSPQTGPSVSVHKSLPDLTSSLHDKMSLNSESRVGEDSVDSARVTPSSNSKPQILNMNIVKGPMGFGFTIADSAYGQRVKQILDRPRCKTLQEGDVLVEINQYKVKDMAHTDVVRVLKDCAKGTEATVVVQRGGILTPSRTRKNTDRSSPARSSSDDRSHVSEHTYSNVPRIPFYSPADKKDSKNTEKESDREKEKEGKETNKENMANKSADITPSENTVNHISSGRSKTPSIENTQPVPHLEHRSKTPTTEMMGQMGLNHDQRHGGSYGNINRPPFTDVHNFGVQRDLYTRGAQPERLSPRDNNLYESRPDYTMHGYSPTRTAGGTTNHSFHEPFSHNPRPEDSRSRSRTPGPEFMRGQEEFNRRPPESRSKTPTDYPPSRQTSTISGTPDFVPASAYQAPYAPPNRAPNSTSQYSGSSRSSDGPRNNLDSSHPSYNPYSPNQRLNSAASYQNSPNLSNPSRTYRPAFDNAGRPLSPTLDPKKQSTSFEHVEPAPSNMTRLQKWNSSPSGSLERSHSPMHRGEAPMEMTVTLRRQDSGFGFRIIGGTEEGSQVSVGYIVPGGSAEVDGRLRPGDEILYVNNQCVIGSSHHRVVQIMGAASNSGQVTLHVRRKPATSDSSYRGQQDGYPYDVTVIRRENEGFGFVIISSVTKAGSVIGKIIEGSPAERCGLLHVGDRILAVNGTDISHMHHEEIVSIIKVSGYSVTLTIGSPQGSDDASSTTSNSQRLGSSTGSVVNALTHPAQSESDLSRRSDYSPYHNSVPAPSQPRINNSHYPHQPVLDKQREIQRLRNMASQPSPELEEEKYREVELHRGSRGFGFSIRGGKEFDNMPLYVLRIADGGAADLDKRLRVGDQIIEINGYNTTNMTHADAIELISSGGSTVKLLIKRTEKISPNFGANPPGGPAVRSPSSNPSPLPSMPNGPIRGLGQGSPVGQGSPRSIQIDSRNPYIYNNSTNPYGQQPSRPNLGY